MTRTLARALAPMMAAALVIAGCGSDADEAEETPPPVEAEAEAEVEEPVVEEEVEEAAPETDVFATVGLMTSGLPEGWLTIKTVEDFEQFVDQASPMIIDVRETGEYAEGFIPGAVNIPIRTLGENLDAIPLDTPVVVYCKSGYRAGLATGALRAAGFENVRAFTGGYKAWTAAEKEVATEPVELPEGEPKDLDPAMVEAVNDFLVPLPEGFGNVGDVEKMQAAMDAGAYLVDVREPGEFAEGHLPGAVNVPLRTLMDEAENFPTDRQIIVYCKSGYRAALANAALNVAGFDNVKAFAGSYKAWTDAGLEVVV